MNEEVLDSSFIQPDKFGSTESQKEQIDSSKSITASQEIDFSLSAEQGADARQTQRILEELKVVGIKDNNEVKIDQDDLPSHKIEVEPEEKPKFHSTTLIRGEEGINLGKYRDAIAKFYGKLFYYPEDEIDDVKKNHRLFCC